MNYNYNLRSEVKEDISDRQAQELEEKGFIYNPSAQTYDLYEEVKAKRKIYTIEYYEEKEVDVPLVKIEVYETKKIKEVEYKVVEKSGIIGFFKKFTQKLFPKKEVNVSDERIKELELQMAKGEIYDLSIKEKMTSQKTVQKVTQSYMNSLDIPFSFLWKTSETQKEIQKTLRTVDISEEELIEYEDKEIVSEEMYEEEYVKEKLIVERRRKLTITQDLYIPGIWSKDYNHPSGTKASFVGTLEITYLSGYNPYDERYVDLSDIKERLIKIIESEHGNAWYIRQRNDHQDGFNIEESKFIN